MNHQVSLAGKVLEGGWPGMQTRQEEGTGRAAAWHRQEIGAGGQHRVAGAGGARGAWGCPCKMLWPRRTFSLVPEWLRVVGEVQPLLARGWSAALAARKASGGGKRICKGSELLG